VVEGPGFVAGTSDAALALSSSNGNIGGTAAAASSGSTDEASVAAAALSGAEGPVGWAGVMLLVQNSAFMSTTVAAALNDVASYALVAWQVSEGVSVSVSVGVSVSVSVSGVAQPCPRSMAGW